MKKRKLIPALALILALLCGITIGATASSTMQQIQAYLNYGIAIKYDGQEQIMKDVNGTRLYPITYKDSTYVPVRAISELLGVNVNWDGATNSVLLGKQPGGVDLIDSYKAYHISGYAGQVQTADGKTEDISGVSCNHWLEFNSDAAKRTFSISFNLQGKHDTLTFSYYAENDANLTVLGDDGKILGEYPITGGAVAKTVTIPLAHTNELKFQMELSRHAKIFNAYLDAE